MTVYKIAGAQTEGKRAKDDERGCGERRGKRVYGIDEQNTNSNSNSNKNNNSNNNEKSVLPAPEPAPAATTTITNQTEEEKTTHEKIAA